jgi:DNA-binding NarL/FixJ family response regulator
MNSTASSVAQEPVVLVVDDHQLFSSSLVLALAVRGLRGYQCATTSTADILRSAEPFPPGLVLLDLGLGLGVGGAPIDEIELITEFHARGWSTVVVSAATDERRIAAAVAAGAIGYVSKRAPLADLLDVVGAAAAGRLVLTDAARARWLEVDRRARRAQRHDSDRLRRLTSREREVLECLARGERAATVAEYLVVSLTTVRSHIRSILTKLEVNSQLEAVALLRRAHGDDNYHEDRNE